MLLGAFASTVMLLASISVSASAQSTSLPAMQIMSAPLQSPAYAQATYGSSTTHTSSFLGISGFDAVAPEIVETARALKNDPDLIFEFVHNQIEIEHAFGLRKGPLGALIEKSGTAFDQNALFVALIRQAGFQARFKIGQVTISTANFAGWTGISNVQAACKLLAAGGIPATFNSAASWPSDCSQGSSFDTTTILHIWSEVNIGGTWYTFDPSFKLHTTDPSFKSLTTSPGRDVVAGSGIVSGQAAAQAATTIVSGSQAGSNYVRSANAASLNSYLTAHGSQLLSDLTVNARDLDTDTLIGIPKIVPSYKPASGWRNTMPPDYTTGGSVIAITGEIPDQYRSTLHLTVSEWMGNSDYTPLLDKQFFVDDIDSRRLYVTSTFVVDSLRSTLGNDFSTPVGVNQLPPPVTLSLIFDDMTIATADSVPLFAKGKVTLTATHPYLANSGNYGRQTVSFDISTLASPIAIVSGWGNVSPVLGAKWRRESVLDGKYMTAPSPFPCPNLDNGPAPETCWDTSPQPAGDVTNQQLGANWLAQLTRMLAIQAQLGGGKADHQHSIGVVNGQGFMLQTTYPSATIPTSRNYYNVADRFTNLNISTAISVTSTSNDTNRRNAIARSVAVSAAALEGSVIEQTQDLPDTTSTVTRFAWGNSPLDEDPCAAGSRRVYDFTGSSNASRTGLYTYEGFGNGCSASMNLVGIGGTPAGATARIGSLEGVVNSYLSAGFNVTASAETFLGPGARFSVAVPGDNTYNFDSMQRGGALIATQYDTSGDVVQIAHTLIGVNGISKGGGGMPPERFVNYDPSKAADVLKDRFVDRSTVMGVDLKTGEAAYSTPILLSVGGKEAPYGLQFSVTFKPGLGSCYDPCIGPVQGGGGRIIGT